MRRDILHHIASGKANVVENSHDTADTLTERPLSPSDHIGEFRSAEERLDEAFELARQAKSQVDRVLKQWRGKFAMNPLSSDTAASAASGTHDTRPSLQGESATSSRSVYEEAKGRCWEDQIEVISELLQRREGDVTRHGDHASSGTASSSTPSSSNYNTAGTSSSFQKKLKELRELAWRQSEDQLDEVLQTWRGEKVEAGTAPDRLDFALSDTLEAQPLVSSTRVTTSCSADAQGQTHPEIDELAVSHAFVPALFVFIGIIMSMTLQERDKRCIDKPSTVFVRALWYIAVVYGFAFYAVSQTRNIKFWRHLTSIPIIVLAAVWMTMMAQHCVFGGP